jgi:hypothetical protein
VGVQVQKRTLKDKRIMEGIKGIYINRMTKKRSVVVADLQVLLHLIQDLVSQTKIRKKRSLEGNRQLIKAKSRKNHHPLLLLIPLLLGQEGIKKKRKR